MLLTYWWLLCGGVDVDVSLWGGSLVKYPMARAIKPWCHSIMFRIIPNLLPSFGINTQHHDGFNTLVTVYW